MTEPVTNRAEELSASPPFYATFPRRLNALTLDSLVLLGVSIAIFTLGATFQGVGAVRNSLFVSWWLSLLFYEPLLVWRRGGTVGHAVMNLRVVDNQTGNNIGFLKAVTRFGIKGLLGIVSFFTMNFSRRHQALHDILTGSSVRIRDAARALPHQYTLGGPASTASETTTGEDSAVLQDAPVPVETESRRPMPLFWKMALVLFLLLVVLRVVWLVIKEGV